MKTYNSEDMQQSIEKITKQIRTILSDCSPSIYLFGSCVLEDFRLGWSDIDILVLTQQEISGQQAENLLMLRQNMLLNEPDNVYYRSVEGGMLTLAAFLSQQPDTVVYWGTSGQKITDKYAFDSFSMVELLENGVLLYGEDLRSCMKKPEPRQLYSDVKHHYETIRKYAKRTDRSLYSFGWLLDIARCIYTLRTGKVVAKTAAGEWALEHQLCPAPEVIETALRVRRDPLNSKADPSVMDYAQALGPEVQKFADVLEKELDESRLCRQ